MSDTSEIVNSWLDTLSDRSSYHSQGSMESEVFEEPCEQPASRQEAFKKACDLILELAHQDLI